MKYREYRLPVVCTGRVSHFHLQGQTSVRQERSVCCLLSGCGGMGQDPTQQHTPVGVSQCSGKARVISNLRFPLKEEFSFVWSARWRGYNLC